MMKIFKYFKKDVKSSFNYDSKQSENIKFSISYIKKVI